MSSNICKVKWKIVTIFTSGPMSDLWHYIAFHLETEVIFYQHYRICHNIALSAVFHSKTLFQWLSLQSGVDKSSGGPASQDNTLKSGAAQPGTTDLSVGQPERETQKHFFKKTSQIKKIVKSAK